MLEVNMGVQGAKRSRYYPDSPDALLRKIVERNRSATEVEIEELFEEQVLKYSGTVLSAIIAYWFANRYRALVHELTPISVRREKKAAAEKALLAKVEVVKKATVAKIARILLDKTVPGCGKPLADMTREDCNREGGWYIKIASKLKRGQTVRDAHITDDELWKLYTS